MTDTAGGGREREAAVLGGGLAGLAAATALVEAGVDTVLVEGRGSLGGRTRSFRDEESGDDLDTGQHVLLGCYDEMFRYLERVGTRGLVRLQDTLTVELAGEGNVRARLAAPPLPPPFHLGAALLGHALLSPVEKLRALHPVLDARLRCDDPALDRLSAAEWLRSRGQSDGALRALWAPLCLATLNAPLEHASAQLLAVVIARGLLGAGKASSIGVSTVGLSDLCAAPGAAFLARLGAEVALNQPVRGLLVEDGRCRGLVLRDGAALRARHVVSAVPAQALLALLPPEDRRRPPFDGLARFVPSPIVSAHAWLDRPVLDTAFVGFVGTELHWAFDRARTWGTPARGGHLVSLVVSGADDLASLPSEEVFSRCWLDFTACLPVAREARVLRSLVVKERAATFRPRPGLASARFGPRTPLPGLVVAGDWTDTGLPATMEGACLSGHRAAEAVRAAASPPR